MNALDEFGRPVKVYWKGWEYESQNGLHMIISKIHLVIGNKTVCGKDFPVKLGSLDCGRGICHKCQLAIPRLEKEGFEIEDQF